MCSVILLSGEKRQEMTLFSPRIEIVETQVLLARRPFFSSSIALATVMKCHPFTSTACWEICGCLVTSNFSERTENLENVIQFVLTYCYVNSVFTHFRIQPVSVTNLLFTELRVLCLKELLPCLSTTAITGYLFLPFLYRKENTLTGQ